MKALTKLFSQAPAGNRILGKRQGMFGLRPVHQTLEEALGGTLMLSCICAGRTNALVSQAAQVIEKREGLVWVDVKGDMNLPAKLSMLAAAQGAPLLIMNLLGSSLVPRQSNTFNPLEGLSSEEIVQWLTTVFGSPAQRFAGALAPALVEGEKAGLWKVDLSRVASFLSMSELDGLGSLPQLSEHARSQVLALLEQAQGDPKGYAREAKEFEKELSPFTEEYGHIFNANNSAPSEINLKAALEQRQIVLASLPCLERAPDHYAKLARAIVASLMLAAKKIEGASQQESVLSTVVMDEFGYYACDAMVDLQAHAKAAGIALWFCDQGLPQVRRTNWDAATQVMQHCNTRIFAKNCESDATAEFFYASQPQHTPYYLHQSLKNFHPGEAYIFKQTSPSFSEQIKMHYVDVRNKQGVFKLSSDGLAFTPEPSS